MYVQVKSSNGISLVPVETRLLAKRRIFLEGEINQEMACEFVRRVMILAEEDPEKPIDIMINSPGGEINAGWMLYDVIQSSKTPLRLFCLGRAYSMAAVLFASGKSGRYMLPNSELMLHEPLLGNRVSGSSSSIKSISDSLLETKRKMNAILVKHTGRTEEEIENVISYDHYFTAEESILFGLCDKIVGFGEMMGWKTE